jgi:hypothetical protein
VNSKRWVGYYAVTSSQLGSDLKLFVIAYWLSVFALVQQNLETESSYRAHAKRGLMISVEAFDWNCPQHITPRYTRAEVDHEVLSLKTKVNELEAELARHTS